MAGDPLNTEYWTDADVYVAALDAEAPDTIGDDFSEAWTLLGLLDGDDGMDESRDEDVNDFYAWGGILYRRTRQHFKLTKKFTCLEYNADVRALLWPNSPAGTLIVPRPGKIKVAFETREGSVKKRLITRNYAEVDVDGDVAINESDPQKYAFMATIFPVWVPDLDLPDGNTGASVLFDEQTNEPAVSA